MLTSSNDSDNDSLWLTQNMYPLGSISGFTYIKDMLLRAGCTASLKGMISTNASL